MKYLLAVGCSFTAGDGLPKRSIVPGSNEPSHTNDAQDRTPMTSPPKRSSQAHPLKALQYPPIASP